jgi:hypothetical protein
MADYGSGGWGFESLAARTTPQVSGPGLIWFACLAGSPVAGFRCQQDLVARVLVLAMAFRSGGIGPVSSEAPLPDPALLSFLYELGEIAAAGGDIRERLFS